MNEANSHKTASQGCSVRKTGCPEQLSDELKLSRCESHQLKEFPIFYMEKTKFDPLSKSYASVRNCQALGYEAAGVSSKV